MSLKDLFPENSPREDRLLANIDVLVELGIPREVAERSARWAFEALDKAIYQNLRDINKACSTNSQDDMLERTIRRSLFMGGLQNWLDSKILLTSYATQGAIDIYKAREDKANG